MTQRTHVSVASYIRQLAKANNVTANRDGMSRIAATITALADNSVELDSVEQLLVNLKRKGIFVQNRNSTVSGTLHT